jgi:hypothetical protein
VSPRFPHGAARAWAGWLRTLGLTAALVAAPVTTALDATAATATAAEGPGEYEVKAALLFNFARFVEWPASSFSGADAPFVVAVVGNDPFGPALERTLSGKAIGGRPIQVRRWRKARDRGPCQILFVAASERGSLRAILDEVREQPVLTVGDMTDFATSGGIIGLVMDRNHVRFEINSTNATRAHLAISSRLLSLARVVTNSL